MAKIDKFIQAIFQMKADRLVATSGERVGLRIGSEIRPVTGQPASAKQLGALIQEIVPPAQAAEVQSDGTSEFLVALDVAYEDQVPLGGHGAAS